MSEPIPAHRSRLEALCGTRRTTHELRLRALHLADVVHRPAAMAGDSGNAATASATS